MNFSDIWKRVNGEKQMAVSDIYAQQVAMNNSSLTGGGVLGVIGGGGGAYGNSLGYVGPSMYPNTVVPSNLAMIAMRMRWTHTVPSAFQLLETVTLKNGNVMVLIVHNDKITHFEDEPNLFPSDTLIAKLKLLIG